jgi:hypothetical protein
MNLIRGAVIVLLVMLLTLLSVTASVANGDVQPRPGVRFTVSPAAAGLQVLRASLRLPPGFLGTNQPCTVTASGPQAEPAAVRVLSWYPATNAGARTARRALVTFPHRFAGTNAVMFKLQPAKSSEATPGDFPVTLVADGESFTLAWKNGRKMDLKFIAPPRASRERPSVETVEESRFYRWQRIHFPDREWPRMIEFRFDAAGTVVAVAHLQRGTINDCYAPEMAWELATSAKRVGQTANSVPRPVTGERQSHSFASGAEWTCLLDDEVAIYHPTAPLKRRGQVEVIPANEGRWTYRYLRCRADDKVPMQPMAWQRAEVVIAPPELARLTASLSSPHRVEPEPKLWAALYGDLEPLPKLPPMLDKLVLYHRDAVVSSGAVGDDFGNVTTYQSGVPHGSAFGMNRLNHGAAIFQTGWRAGDRRPTETGLLWCDNFHDQSIWWGEPERGGTRYVNIVALNRTPPTRDYMWRSDDSVNFCTKGYDCFWLAWEETGDPRMMDALLAQTAYAAKSIHANTGEWRNIGDVRDFIRLYQYSGEREYLDQAAGHWIPTRRLSRKTRAA